MAYLARRDLIFNGAIFHITWKCHNNSWFLEDEGSKKLYYNLLLKYKTRYGVSIYSYCFMSNHPHLTGKTETVNGLSAFMRTVNSQFARYINKNNKRCGQVVMDRFKSPIIQTDEALMNVILYTDLNPSRARIVSHPKNYKWCSYRYYAHGEDDPVITSAPSYLALAKHPKDRQAQYRIMVDIILKDDNQNFNYSRTCFIGDPDWVKARYEELKKLKRARRITYLIHQQRMNHAQSPP